MSRQSETVLPGFLFAGTWWTLGYYPFFEPYAFFWAAALSLVGYMAIRVLGGATHRLGFRGWLLILQLAIGYGLFLQFVPLDSITKILLLWGIATPLLLIGSAWRRVYDRFPSVDRLLNAIVCILGCVACAAVLILAWRSGGAFRPELVFNGIACVLGCTLLYYGWRLAEPLPSGKYDARFGTQDDFRHAGVSDER